MKQGLYKSLLKKTKFIGASEGTSMMPIIYPKDELYIKSASIGQLKINDIITFQKKRKLITHRIIYKKQGYIITKGDNNLQSDGKIYSNQILGIIKKIKRGKNIFDPESIFLVQSTLYFQEIIKIINIFEKENVNYIFLKGLPLHLYFEKIHPRRIYADCDLLIYKKDFQKAEKIIEKFGYRRTNKKNRPVENSYYKNINGFPVIFDLHLESAFLMTRFSGLEALYQQKLINQFTERLLNSKQQIKINDKEFLILNFKFLILYLSLHFFHHNFRGAFRLDFLDKIIKKSHLQKKGWTDIANIINQFQLSNFVYPVFKLLQKYYQTPLPNEFFRKIQPINLLTRKLISKLIKTTNMFDDESRFTAGINRFKNLYLLSPRPWQKKIFVFINPSVIYFIFWSLKKKLFSFFSNRKETQ